MPLQVVFVFFRRKKINKNLKHHKNQSLNTKEEDTHGLFDRMAKGWESMTEMHIVGCRAAPRVIFVYSLSNKVHGCFFCFMHAAWIIKEPTTRSIVSARNTIGPWEKGTNLPPGALQSTLTCLVTCCELTEKIRETLLWDKEKIPGHLVIEKENERERARNNLLIVETIYTNKESGERERKRAGPWQCLPAWETFWKTHFYDLKWNTLQSIKSLFSFFLLIWSLSLTLKSTNYGEAQR